MLRFAAIAGFLFCSAPGCAQTAGQVEYVGGTVPGVKQATQGNLRTVDADYLAFLSRKFTLKVLYERVNLLEYGQELDTQRNYALALVSPILFLSKKRTHFLTVGYADDEGRQQAMYSAWPQGISAHCWRAWRRGPGRRCNCRIMRPGRRAGGSPCVDG